MKKKEEELNFKTLVVGVGAVKYKTLLTKKYENRTPYIPHNPDMIYSFIPGTILNVYVKEGQKVKKGDKLLILDAMKMKNEMLAPRDCVIKSVPVKDGERVPKSQLLVEFEAETE